MGGEDSPLLLQPFTGVVPHSDVVCDCHTNLLCCYKVEPNKDFLNVGHVACNQTYYFFRLEALQHDLMYIHPSPHLFCVGCANLHALQN